MTATVEDLKAVERLIKALPREKVRELAALPAVKWRLGATCHLTERQIEAEALLNSDAVHAMLFGGSRSGKTFLIVREIVRRALDVAGSRHAILRFRFNHVVASIVHDTLPKVMEVCFPGAKDDAKMNREQWFYTLPNGSELWFGGLDDKERTEKILGQEYASLFLNECSQIPWSSRVMAMTRLAQNTALPLKAFYDCNPPSKAHWTYKLFIDSVDPSSHQPLRNSENYAALQINPDHNRKNLPDGYLQELDSLPSRQRMRFLLGIFSDEAENVLWSQENLDKHRLIDKAPPDMSRIVIAVDPSGCSGPEDVRSDEIGIMVVGLGIDGRGYVLEDLSGRFSPEKWKTVIASAYERHNADCVVAETNFGGAMVGEVVRTARQDGLSIPFREVKASRGKVVRAEPISALFEQGKVSLVGHHRNLEDQLCSMTTAGYMGPRSPDRADAMVWGLTELFPMMTRKPEHRRPNVLTGHKPYKYGGRTL